MALLFSLKLWEEKSCKKKVRLQPLILCMEGGGLGLNDPAIKKITFFLRLHFPKLSKSLSLEICCKISSDFRHKWEYIGHEKHKSFKVQEKRKRQ